MYNLQVLKYFYFHIDEVIIKCSLSRFLIQKMLLKRPRPETKMFKVGFEESKASNWTYAHNHMASQGLK